MLRGWREAFGSSEAAARSLAAVFGVVGVPLLFVLGRDLLGTTAALWACAIYAVAGPQVQLGQEVRGYVPLVTLTLAAAVICVRTERRRGSTLGYVLLAGCVLAMLLTHYFSVGPILGISVYILIRFRGAVRWRAIGAIAAGGAVYAVLWGPMLLQQFNRLGNVHDWVDEARAGHLGRTLGRAAVLPVTYLNEPMGTTFALAAVGVVAYVLPLALLRRRPGLLLPWLLLVCGVGFVMALDVIRASGQLMYVRYTLAAAPAAYLLFAGIASDVRVARHLLPVAAVASCLVSLPRAYTYHTPPKPDWRGFAAEVTRDGPVDTLVFLGGRGDSWLTSTYLGLHYYLHPKPKYVVLIDGTTISDEARRHLRASPSVWAMTLPDKPRPIPAGFEVERWTVLPRTVSAMKLRTND
jgi:uncharacterized membrane protein